MKKREIDLKAAEAMSRALYNQFAEDRGWEDSSLVVPYNDLAIFLSNIRGEKMLDIGCGWGTYIEEFLSRGLQYVGLDNSLGVIKVARELHLDQMFNVGSLSQLPYPSDYFDGLWCSCSLGTTPKAYLPAALAEHYRVLKAGGCMVVVMPAYPDSYEGVDTVMAGGFDLYHSTYYLDELEGYFQEARFCVIDSGHRPQNGAMYLLLMK